MATVLNQLLMTYGYSYREVHLSILIWEALICSRWQSNQSACQEEEIRECSDLSGIPISYSILPGIITEEEMEVLSEP